MKNYLIPFLFVFVFFSCTKPAKDTIVYKLRTKPVDSAALKTIVLQLKNTGAFSSKSESRLEDINEDSIALLIAPLVENGRELQTELISFISNSSSWQALPQSAKDTIVNMTDEQLASLSLAYSTFEYGRQSPIANMIHDCVGVALGLQGLQSIFTSLATAPTITSAIGVLRWVGSRFLSYASIAWMIWDFWDCLGHFNIGPNSHKFARNPNLRLLDN